MKRNYDYGSRSITSWGYVWRNVLYCIPVLGWIIWFTRLFARNRNVRNHARSFICGFVLLLIVAAIAAVAYFVAKQFIDVDAEIKALLNKGIDLVEGFLKK